MYKFIFSEKCVLEWAFGPRLTNEVTYWAYWSYTADKKDWIRITKASMTRNYAFFVHGACNRNIYFWFQYDPQIKMVESSVEYLEFTFEQWIAYLVDIWRAKIVKVQIVIAFFSKFDS